MKTMRLCNMQPPCTPDCPARAVGCARRLESKRLNWDCDTYTPTHERARVRLQHARGKHK